MDLVLVKWHCADTTQYWRVQKKIFYKTIKQNSNPFQRSLFPKTITDANGEFKLLVSFVILIIIAVKNEQVVTDQKK